MASCARGQTQNVRHKVLDVRRHTQDVKLKVSHAISYTSCIKVYSQTSSVTHNVLDTRCQTQRVRRNA